MWLQTAERDSIDCIGARVGHWALVKETVGAAHHAPGRRAAKRVGTGRDVVGACGIKLPRILHQGAKLRGV